MKKYRSLAIISAIACALSFTACGETADSSGNSKSDDAGNYVQDPGASYDAADEYIGETYSNESKNSVNSGKYAPSGTATTTYASTNVYGTYVGADEEEFPDGAFEESPAAEEAAPAEIGYMNGASIAYAPDTEEYAHLEENGFQRVTTNPLSTFSADVDTASYTNIRRMLNNGNEPYPDMVRIEEILNYFDYDYPQPKTGEPFSVTTELSDCPWNSGHQLMLVGIKADESQVKKDLPMNLVFLIDVSGSMFDDDKLPLVQQAFSMLTDNLDEEDRISIVTYAGEDKVVLEGKSGGSKKEIKDAIESLSAGGATAGAAGIHTAYDIAENYFIEGGNNRVILATDGDLNVGQSSVEDLTTLIENEREKGVFLSVLGFGEGNYKDNRLEALADNGNGNYSYIDSLTEAKKVLIDEMSATLVTVAKDVKFQVEFNPANVAGYRLIGYENRLLADRDFNDDTKDAGEVGAGSTVTVLYEIVPNNGEYHPETEPQNYRYSENAPEVTAPVVTTVTAGEYADELLTVNIRCKAPDGNESKLYTYPVSKNIYDREMPKNLNFAACCTEFGMLLKHSENMGSASWSSIKDMLGRYDYSDDEYKSEFGYLVRLGEKYVGSKYYDYYDSYYDEYYGE